MRELLATHTYVRFSLAENTDGRLMVRVLHRTNFSTWLGEFYPAVKDTRNRERCEWCLAKFQAAVPAAPVASRMRLMEESRKVDHDFRPSNCIDSYHIAYFCSHNSLFVQNFNVKTLYNHLYVDTTYVHSVVRKITATLSMAIATLFSPFSFIYNEQDITVEILSFARFYEKRRK